MITNPEKIRLVRVLAFVEASSVTGPAKNLIELARSAPHVHGSDAIVNLAFATFQRGRARDANEFLLACQRAGVQTYVIREHFVFDPSVLAGVREVITAHNPDILQTHSVKSHLLVKLSGMCRQYRWIAFHHGYTWVNSKVRLYNQFDRLSLRSASRVVTVCSAFKAELENFGVAAERIVIQHNSVRPFSPTNESIVLQFRKSMKISPGTQIILSVGRLSREKGQANLIEAFSLVCRGKRDPNLKLILVGTGPDEQTLKRMVTNLGLGQSVFFAGHQSDVSPFYTTATVMVLPSHTEGSPNVLLEAMAAGLPIVATAVGGIPEIVATEKEALLVGKNDAVALAHAMERLLTDENLRKRMAMAAQARAAAYSPEGYCKSIFSLYRKCMAEDFGHGRAR